MSDSYDVVVIGGGAAGLSGAIALARSRRSVLVVDAGEPRNAPAAGVHNFLTRDGTPPAEIYALGREELRGYGGTVVSGRVSRLSREGELFRVAFTGPHGGEPGSEQGGERSVTARRLLVATGLRDELPDIPGLRARWGIDVLHCPYCHGWEVRDKRVGILATSAGAAHQALLFRQLTPHVIVLRHSPGAGTVEFSVEQRQQFAALGIDVVDGPVSEVETREVSGVETREAEAGPAAEGKTGADGTALAGVRLASGTRVALDALVVAPVMRANAELLASLGLVEVEVRAGDQLMGTQIEADPTGATEVPGVWVAGNVAVVHAQVMSSAAAGVLAGAAINMDLVAEDARRAIRSRIAA